MPAKEMAGAHAGAISLRPVRALLISVAILVLGNGLQGTLLAVRAGLEGFPEWAIGAMMSGYFAGYLAGSMFLPRAVARAGHVRVFAAFASMASAIALAHLLAIEWWAWIALLAAVRIPLRKAPQREAAPRVTGEHVPVALDPRAHSSRRNPRGAL